MRALRQKFPHVTGFAHLQVLQADGGTRSACFNAAVMALVDAGVAMRDLLAACSVGYLEVRTNGSWESSCVCAADGLPWRPSLATLDKDVAAWAGLPLVSRG